MDALALLRLQIEWGADEALSEDPVDRLRPAVREARSTPEPARAPVVRATPTVEPPRASPLDRAAAAAGQANSLAALRQAVAAFDGCTLRETATNLVFAEGDPSGRLLLIGEAPGADEDRSGHPFTGADGAFLDKMLGSIGLERSGMLLVPLIPWRPPGGRPPTAGELAACLPFLHRLIELASPNHLVLLGTLTARTLLPARRRSGGWVELAGSWGSIPALTLPGLGTLRKTPSQRREAWAGLRLLRRALDGGPADIH